jgi:hypothetical protein
LIPLERDDDAGTMSNPHDDDKKKKGDDKKHNTYFAGDGQALDGGDGSNAADNGASAVEDLFNKARENGAVKPEDFTSHSSSTFAGTGRRLGHQPGPSLPVQPMQKEEQKVKITFYRNGFTVDEGDLRNPEDPGQKAFLDTLNKGFVPRDIAEQHPGKNIVVALEDRSGEEYVKQFKAFGGSGQRLAAEPAGAAAAAVDRAAEAAGAGAWSFSEDEPVGKVVLQMVDGSKQEVKVNPQRHTVADLRGKVAELARCSPSDFNLIVRELRPRTLTEPAETLAAAKAFNCIVMVKAR